MNAIAAPTAWKRWDAQSCTDTRIEGIEHARGTLTGHGVHGCPLFFAALDYCSAALQ